MKKYIIIANPTAGRGSAELIINKAAELFQKKGVAVDFEFTQGPNDAARIAKRSLEHYDIIVAAGGDGTVNEIIPVLLHTGKPLGIIPAGSGNDFIKSLSIRPDVESAVDIILQGYTRTIDAGRMNEIYFVNGIGIGFDAAVNHASYGISHSKKGLYLYLLALLKTLGQYRPVKLAFSLEGEAEGSKQDTFLLTIGNGTTCGGGFRLTPAAKLDDHLFDITRVEPIGILPLLWHFPKVFSGAIYKAKKYARMYRSDRISIRADIDIPVHVDGEIYRGNTRHLEISLVPNAITVIANSAQ
jgi:diacylglycerol kinase (ATP)